MISYSEQLSKDWLEIAGNGYLNGEFVLYLRATEVYYVVDIIPKDDIIAYKRVYRCCDELSLDSAKLIATNHQCYQWSDVLALVQYIESLTCNNIRGESHMKKCPFCKNGYLERNTICETYQYLGFTIEIEQPGEYCNSCDGGILSSNDLKTTEKQIQEFQRHVNTQRLPSEIRRIREKLNLTQKQAAELCGGGANAFSRYETGQAIPIRATVNLLRLLEKHPDQLQEIL